MAESLEILIGIQGKIAQCRRLAAETADSKTVKRLLRLADEIEQRVREVDRLPGPTILDADRGCEQAKPAIWIQFERLIGSMLDPRMSTDDDFRRQAVECLRMAENAISSDDRQAWLRLADAWLQLLPRLPESRKLPKPGDEDLE